MKSFLKKIGLNRIIQDQQLHISFKKPWSYLAQTTISAYAHKEIAGANTQWWSLLKKVRTHYEQNPAAQS